MIETQALFPGFSGRRNPGLLAGMEGIPGSAVDEALERVRLADRADDRLETYSLGMRQRLGLAAALLKDPHQLTLARPGQHWGNSAPREGTSQRGRTLARDPVPPWPI